MQSIYYLKYSYDPESIHLCFFASFYYASESEA